MQPSVHQRKLFYNVMDSPSENTTPNCDKYIHETHLLALLAASPSCPLAVRAWQPPNLISGQGASRQNLSV